MNKCIYYLVFLNKQIYFQVFMKNMFNTGCSINYSFLLGATEEMDLLLGVSGELILLLGVHKEVDSLLLQVFLTNQIYSQVLLKNYVFSQVFLKNSPVWVFWLLGFLSPTTFAMSMDRVSKRIRDFSRIIFNLFFCTYTKNMLNFLFLILFSFVLKFIAEFSIKQQKEHLYYL